MTTSTPEAFREDEAPDYAAAMAQRREEFFDQATPEEAAAQLRAEGRRW